MSVNTLKLCEKLQARYENDPVGWIHEFISFDGLKYNRLTDQQVQIAEALVRHKNVCVSAGGGIGKTALTAMLILWFLCTHPMSKIPTTAPTGAQLHDVLWSELALWLRRCRLSRIFKLRKRVLYVGDFREWFAVARTIPKDKKDVNDTMAGFHAPYILCCVDEASGVPDQVFTAIEGALTDRNSYVILISNPVSTGGYYYDTITDPENKGKKYKVLYFDSRESPLVDPEFEERIISRWGKNSAMYIAKVTGRPISEYDSVVVAPQVFDDVVSRNTALDRGQIILSCDVGGGSDLTVLCYRIGSSVFKWEELNNVDPTYIADYIKLVHESQFNSAAFAVVVDGHGIGAGVYSELKKYNRFPVYKFVGPEKAYRSDMFDIRRTEGYYNLHKKFTQLNFPTPPPQRLKKELANLKFLYGQGQIKMEPKETFRRRVGCSPDYADALMMNLTVDVAAEFAAPKLVSRRTISVMRRLHTKSDLGKYQKFM